MNKPATPLPTTNERRSFPAAEFRFVPAEGDKPPQVTGYAAVFNAPSEDLGGFREIVKPGAFKRSLDAGADVRLLINHTGEPLARTKSGTLKLSEDARGLRFEASLDPTDPDVQRLIPKMKRGDLNQCSFAFATRSDTWRSQDGQTFRDLIDVDPDDVSVVTYAAYPQTSAAIRSYRNWKAGKPSTQTANEARASYEVQDNSLIYYCRWAVQNARDSFDSLNCVLDALAGIQKGTLSDQDMEAAEDLVSTLVDLIGKARRTRATLEALGAEDETDDGDDDEPMATDPVENENALALAEA